MSDPVVLVGTGDDGSLICVGLYESVEAANEAVHMGRVEFAAHYSVFTPQMGTTIFARRASFKPAAVR